MDALEVRYVDLSGKRSGIVFHHEIYVDYGVEEATMYAKHAAALEEFYRLFPAILAEVDPQAFWSAVLWLQAFIETLQDLKVSADLIDEWKALKDGKATSKKDFEYAMNSFGFGCGSLKGPEDHFGITKKSQDVHLRIATDYAIGAVQALQKALVENASTLSATSVKMNTLDYYIGTELDNYVTGLHKFFEMAREEGIGSGRGIATDLESEQTRYLFNKAMKSVGFGRDSKFRIQDPEQKCDYCGRRFKHKLTGTCARCEGVSYCNAECQRAHWKEHKPNCSRFLVQFEKTMSRMGINAPGGPQITPGLYPSGSSSLPPGPSMISEVSGTGMMSLFWNPGGTSYINIPNVNLSDLASGRTGLEDDDGTGLENAIRFNDFSQLHPTVRFLICCGPLPQFDIAKQCVSEAIQCCGGRIDQLRVPILGFTALEWAAKKGNFDIVKWLCTDDRTKALVRIGCPIGWAGYTGQTEVMRYLASQGSDPSRTDAVLWEGTLPLHVAAQNGQLDALKFYVDECKQDVAMKDRNGKDILKHIKDPDNWRQLPGHVACHKWAKALLRK